MTTRVNWAMPRFLSRATGRQVWYSVNRGSVTLCFEGNNRVTTRTIRRAHLALMLGEVQARTAQRKAKPMTFQPKAAK